MSEALGEWEAARIRLAADYRARQHGPGESAAFQAYLDGTRKAWRTFAAREPVLAAEIFCDGMLAHVPPSQRVSQGA